METTFYKRRKTAVKAECVDTFLKQYFGGPLSVFSSSLFKSTRIRTGLSLYIIRKYSNLNRDEVAERYRISKNDITDKIEYAIREAPGEIYEIETKFLSSL